MGDLGKIKSLKLQCFQQVCPFKLGQWYFKDYIKMASVNFLSGFKSLTQPLLSLFSFPGKVFCRLLFSAVAFFSYLFSYVHYS